MASVIDTFGGIIEAQAPSHPLRARQLLASAYETVVLRGRVAAQSTYDGLVDRFNGRIARRIIRALRHPERTVIVNIFMPCELFETFGLIPAFPEGIAVYVACTACSGVFAAKAEERGVPESFCSYHKVMLGMAESGVLGRPCLIAATSLACDANQVSFRRLSELTGAPELLIDVPREVDEAAIDYVYDQLLTLTAVLETLTGRRFDPEALGARLTISARTLNAVRTFGAVRGGITLPTTMTGELCTFIATHCLLGTAEAADYASHLVGLARTAKRLNAGCGRRVPRIYWMHTLPNWQMSLRAVFDGGDAAEIVGCDLTDDYQGPLEDPNPLRFLARRIVENTNNGFGRRRIEATLAEANARHADGVVIFGHAGCKQTLGLSGLAQDRFESAGLPTLVLDGDGCDRRNVSEEAMLTRVHAFMELLGERLHGR